LRDGNGNDAPRVAAAVRSSPLYTNSNAGDVYYVGVKAEDQMAAEYAFLGVFSRDAFSSQDTNGNVTVLGLPVPAIVPDGNAADPGVALVLGLAIQPISVRRVVVTNEFYHQNPATCWHAGAPAEVCRPQQSSRRAAGRLHLRLRRQWRGKCSIRTADRRPGSLRDFVGEPGFGVWLLAMQDNAESNTGGWSS